MVEPLLLPTNFNQPVSLKRTDVDCVAYLQRHGDA
jgi:hypothetical protein